MLTLTGKPGVGKTRLLICAVNEARDAGQPAVYTTMSDLLAYLRRAFNPDLDADGTYEERWELYRTVEVLAVDELDEFSATPWAMERFMRLIDERWRNMDRCVTLLATNSRLSSMPEKIASRLRDGRALLLAITGGDMRPMQKWEDEDD